MKSKAPLAMMEQLVMVLVFALAAALCVQVFVFSNRLSEQNKQRDNAVLAAQTIAETLKGYCGDYAAAAEQVGGHWDGSQWEICYNDQWQTIEGDAECMYRAVIAPAESAYALLSGAQICVYTTEQTELFSLSVAWQKGVDSGV